MNKQNRLYTCSSSLTSLLQLNRCFRKTERRWMGRCRGRAWGRNKNNPFMEKCSSALAQLTCSNRAVELRLPPPPVPVFMMHRRAREATDA
jgi:hypothetical protein